MKRIISIALLLTITLVSFAQESDYCTKVYIDENIEISLYTASMFRYRVSELESEKFPKKYEIPFVIGKLDRWDVVDYKKTEDALSILIKTEKITIKINKQDKSWEVYLPDRSKKIHPTDGQIYGMFKNGYTLFDNASAFNEKNNNDRYTHWFYNDKTKNYTDVFLEENRIADQYYIYGLDYESLFSQFNMLTGAEPLLPIKAYGFFQTQHLACAGTQQQLLDVALKLRKKDIPCDNLIIDFEWGDGCIGNQEIKWGSSLDWNKNYTSPLSPEAMIDSLHNMNYTVMLIHHNAPEFKNRNNQGWTETTYPENIWWEKFKEKLDIGIDGTWQDTRKNDITDSRIWTGHQEYLGAEKRVLFMGCRKMQALNPWDKYYTALPLNQLIGAHRYPFDWTGDCSFSWNEFAWQINAITNTHGSMKGVSYITSDAVGINWKVQARWNQFASLSPIVRSHNPKPWSGDIDAKDFVSKIQITGRDTIELSEEKKINISNKPTAEESIRKYLKLRYRLLPYIYSYAYEKYLTGMPICRPLVLAYPNDHRCSGDQWPYQYMFGNELLVAPVYSDLNTMEIFLPDGKWIDYWNKDVYNGGGVLRYDVTDINKLPLFVKAGAIIPMRQEKNWIDEGELWDTLTLDIYPHGTSSFTLYDDDKKTTHYQQAEYSKTEFICTQAQYSIELNIEKPVGTYKGMPETRIYHFIFNLQKSAPKSVLLNNQMLDSNTWHYSGEKECIIVKVDLENKQNKIEIRFE